MREGEYDPSQHSPYRGPSPAKRPPLRQSPQYLGRPDPVQPSYWAPPDMPRSGLGMASFVLALVGGAMAVGSVGVAVVFAARGLPQSSPALAAVGLGVMGGAFVSFIGAVLGLIALFQENRRKDR